MKLKPKYRLEVISASRNYNPEYMDGTVYDSNDEAVEVVEVQGLGINGILKRDAIWDLIEKAMKES